jgi:hypothetical protein
MLNLSTRAARLAAARNLFSLILLASASLARADDYAATPNHRGWFDATIGVARLGVQPSGAPTTYDNDLSLNIEGGWHLNDDWLLGASLGGISIQSTCAITPTHTCSLGELQRGKGIEHLFAVAEYHSPTQPGWLFHMALGGSQSWRTLSGVDQRGLAGDVGVGYTRPFGDIGRLGIRLDLESGHFAGSGGNAALNYSAPQLLIVWSYD